MNLDFLLEKNSPENDLQLQKLLDGHDIILNIKIFDTLSKREDISTDLMLKILEDGKKVNDPKSLVRIGRTYWREGSLKNLLMAEKYYELAYLKGNLWFLDEYCTLLYEIDTQESFDKLKAILSKKLQFLDNEYWYGRICENKILDNSGFDAALTHYKKSDSVRSRLRIMDMMLKNNECLEIDYFLKLFNEVIEEDKRKIITLLRNNRETNPSVRNLLLEEMYKKGMHEIDFDYISSLFDIGNKELAKNILLKRAREGNTWDQIGLVRMLWSGYKVDKDRELATRLMNEFPVFYNSLPVKTIYLPKREIYKYKTKVVLAASNKSFYKIVTHCLQNNISIDYSYCDDFIPEVFSFKEINGISEDEAVITDLESYDKYIDEIPSKNIYIIDSFDLSSLYEKCIDDVVTIDSKRFTETDIDTECTYMITGDNCLNVYRNMCKKISADNLIINLRDFNDLGYFLIGGLGIRDVRTILDSAYFGRKIYESLSKDECFYLISGKRAMGDDYKSLTMVNSFKKERGISDVKLLIAHKSRDILRLFRYGGLCLSEYLLECLKTYMIFSRNYDSENILLVGGWYPFLTRCSPGLCGNMFDLKARNPVEYKMLQLGLSFNANYDKIFLEDANVDIPKKSILINPSARTLYSECNLKQEFFLIFEKIVNELTTLGYTIYINSNMYEKPLKNTIPINLPMYKMAAISELFDFVLSVRTGFVDVLIYTGCNLGVITPKNFDSMIYIAEKLNKENYYEFQWDNNTDEIIESILDRILNI